jgi:hypothetical protein
MNYYYLDEQNREIGPVSLENLQSFRTAGVIKDHTLVRPESGGPWAPCVTVVGPAESSNVPRTQSQAAKAVGGAVNDAKTALALLWKNPVGGLAPTYQKIGPTRAGGAGFVFGGATIATLLLLVYLTETFRLLRPGDFGGFIKLLLAIAGSLGAWIAALALGRSLNRRGGQWQGEVFVVGVMSLQWTIGLLLWAIVGWKNFEVCGFVALAVTCFTVLQIFVGLTRISGLDEARATLAVPLVVIAGVWLTKIFFTMIYG